MPSNMIARSFKSSTPSFTKFPIDSTNTKQMRKPKKCANASRKGGSSQRNGSNDLFIKTDIVSDTIQETVIDNDDKKISSTVTDKKKLSKKRNSARDNKYAFKF